MKKLLKILLVALFFLSGFLTYSQTNTSEYGILFITQIRRGSSSDGTIGASHNQGSFLYKPTSNDRFEYNYYEFPENFTGTTVRYSDTDVQSSCNETNQTTYTLANFNQTNSFGGCIGQVLTYPIHLPSPAVEDATICPEKEITLRNGYNWQYEIIRNNSLELGWTNLDSEYQRRSSISLKLEDFLNPSELADIKFIRFRTGYNNSFLAHIQYEVTKCSPALVTDPPIVIDEKCEGSNNGSFSATFERSVDVGEKMMVRVTNTLTSVPYSKDFYHGDFNANTIQWPSSIEPGTYYLEWVTITDNGDDTFPDQSKRSQNNFTINEAIPLIFESLNKTNETCAGESNGSIVVEASGGKAPYEYSIDNGTFSVQNTFNSLTVGIHNITIRDSNDCTINQNIEIVAGATLPTFYFTANSTSFAQSGDGVIEVALEDGSNPIGYSYAWSSNDPSFTSQNSPILQNLNNGIYSLIITETVTGCRSNQTNNSFTISPLPELSVSINTNDELHCERDTARLIATASDGSGTGYAYKWYKGPDDSGELLASTTNMISVPQGIYTVEVTDSEGDIQSATYILDYEQPLLSVTENVTQILCKGENSGAIELTISGGLNPEVHWDGSFTSSSANRTELSAGTYTYEIIDENNCRAEGSITITEPPIGITVSATSTEVTTNGFNDGTITLNITNGAGNYNFEWTETTTNTVYYPNLGATPNQFTGFFAGTYQVKVTDINNNGCTTTLDGPVTINEPGPLEIGISPANVTDINCFGESTGRIDANYEGTGPFEFVWYDSAGNELEKGTNDFIENLPEGTYSYTVNDTSNAGPLSSGDIVLFQPGAALSASYNQTNVSCFGDNDGTITITVTGGTAPFLYEIRGNIIQQNTSGLFTNLEAGSYSINVIDDNGCSLPTPIDVDLPTPTQITFEDTDAITPVSRPGDSDGAISVTVQGGVQPYYYRWTGLNVTTPINTENTTIIENLPEGSYTLEVSNKPTFDIDGCYLRRQYTVTELDEFSIQPLTGTPAICSGTADGSVTANIVATGPVTFNWFEVGDPSTPVSVIANTTERTVTLENRGAGEYYLEITDQNGLTVRSADNFEIVELPEVTATIVPVPSCSGESTGSITFSNPVGSTSNTYSYSIDNWATVQDTPVFVNLAAGSYTPRMRTVENPACEFVAPGVTIGTSPILFYDGSANPITRASGPGATDGAIAPTFTGGTLPYTYLWNGGETEPGLSGLSAGTYSVTVTDAAGCSISQYFEVTEIGPLTISDILPNNATCQGEANGSITTTVTGEGTITYRWTLENGDPVPVSNGTDGPNLTGVLAGSYILTVTDDNATRSTEAIAVSEPTTNVTITGVAVTDVSCYGDNDGTLEVQADGGTGPYMYSINGGGYQTSNLFENLSADNYTVSVRDANNCTFTEPTPEIILEPQEMGLFINQQVPVTAAGATDGSISITAEGGSGNYSYLWTGPNGYTSIDKDISGLGAGDYFVTVTDVNYGIDNVAGCRFVSRPITITEPGQLIANLEQTVFLECSDDDFAEITANVQGGVTPYTYQWFQMVNGNQMAMEETTDILGNLVPGSYFLRVADGNSISTDSNPVTVTAPAPLIITVDDITNIICAGEATGAISTSVSGGTPPYRYFWSNSATVPDISGLEQGEYTVDVEDAAGCIAQETIAVTSPDDAVEITDAAISNASQYQAADGTISIEVIGGAAPYSYSWTRVPDGSNAGDRETISDLAAGSYSVEVSDANGCSVTQTYEVDQPDIVEGTIVQPTCSGDANGSISVLANDGNGTFSYLWSTGATESTINNLTAGAYSVTVTGFENGPIQRTYVLENPAPLVIDLGSDRTLCAGQTLELDATVEDATATYTWSSDNGFSSSAPIVELATSGSYTVTVRSETGCTVEGTISVEISTEEIDAEFAVSSQVFTGEPLAAIDISYPLPDGIEWILPVQAKIEAQNSDEAMFSFAEAGEYEITMISTRRGCVAQRTKKILVVARDGLISQEDTEKGQRLIEDFIVYPNPSNGRFTADVSLTERGEIGIKVFSLANNALIASKKDRGELSYSIPFDLSGLPAGVYAVLLETPYGQTLRKVIKK